MAEEGNRVTLNLYDLSQGMARQLSVSVLGRRIEGIWHTGVEVYGNEYYFARGIQHCPAGSAPYGTPIGAFDLGVTQLSQEVFEGYLKEISPRYTAETYSLLTHNCNNFSNEVVQFLVGTSIPTYILELPFDVMHSPFGTLILPMIDQLEATLRSGAVPQAQQFHPMSMAQPSQPMSLIHPMLMARPSDKPSDVSKTAIAGTVLVKKTEKASASTTDDQGPSHGLVKETADNVPKDDMASVRSKLKAEIKQEFAAIMATGTLRASEAAALAVRHVMQRYGITIGMQQGE